MSPARERREHWKRAYIAAMTAGASRFTDELLGDFATTHADEAVRRLELAPRAEGSDGGARGCGDGA